MVRMDGFTDHCANHATHNRYIAARQGLRTNLVHDPILTSSQLDQLTVTPLESAFDGDPARFRLGVEAQRLALAYEYDPYFSLSIARVDPLPHQLDY